jgi:hypothetical protein
MESALREIIPMILPCLVLLKPRKVPLHDLKPYRVRRRLSIRARRNVQLADMTENNPYSRARALVPVEPIPDDLVSLLRLVPEKTVATALHHGEFRVANVIAKMFRRDDMVAGIGIGFIFTAH